MKTPQTPAEGIMLDKDFGVAKFYTVGCDCGDPEHSIKFEVEADDGGVVVNLWSEVSIPWWKETFRTSTIAHDDKFYYQKWWLYSNLNNIINRAKLIWMALVNDQVTMQASVIMREQQTLNFADVLVKASADVKEAQRISSCLLYTSDAADE